MFSRLLFDTIATDLDEAPALALLGPRQVGKTTLALDIAASRRSVYLDLQSPSDRAKLANPELYLSERTDTLVILDEIQLAPGLFPVLRGQIDAQRRAGRKAGMYLLLGSASMELMQQSGESLAGRIAYRELPALSVLEVPVLEVPALQAPVQAAPPANQRRSSASARSPARPHAGARPDNPPQHNALWLRGGFPESLLARDDASSLRWRLNFIRTYLERDVPQFGRRIAAETLRRFWTMLAHHQGAVLNAAALASSLGVDGKTVANWLDLMIDLLLVRRLQPWHASGSAKRLVKSPKVWVRDSGLVHALLGLGDMEALLGHPVAGASWECFVIENLMNIAALAGQQIEASYYRSSAGAEIDLLLTWPDGRCCAIEVKRSLTPKLERGFYSACEQVRPDARFVVYPGSERYSINADVQAISLAELAAIINPVRSTAAPVSPGQARPRPTAASRRRPR